MKKLILVLIGLILYPIFCKADVQIGYGTYKNESLPINPYYGYSYSQVIYTASEINASGTITALKWYFDGSSLTNSNNWTIYLGHTSKSQFDSNNDWIPVEDMTQVYSGTFPNPGMSGWITIDIDDWDYNGTDNLVVAVDENSPGYNGINDNFFCDYSENRGIVFYNDLINPDPANPPSNDAELKDYTPDIILVGLGSEENDCPDPSQQTESNITQTSADLSWTENGSATTWEILWGEKGFSEENGTLVSNLTATEYTLNGLLPETSYDWYVRSICDDNSYSQWVGPSTFSTACGVVSEYPYNEDFTEWPPSCWIVNYNLTGSSEEWEQYESGDVKCARAHFWAQEEGKNDIMISPELDISTLTQPVLSFKWSHKYDSDYPNDSLIVEVSGDGGSSWSRIWSKGNSGFDSNDGADDESPGTFVSTQFIDLSSFGDNILIRFNAKSGYGPDLFLDDVFIGNEPTCFDPSNQNVSNITSSSADLNWTDDSSTSWDIEWGVEGFAQGTGTVISEINAKPYALTGLDSLTSYDWYVRSNCGDGDYSNWVGPYTFTTLQGIAPVQSVPFFEGWETNELSNSKWNWASGTDAKIEINTSSKYDGNYGLKQSSINNGSGYVTPNGLSDAYDKALPGGANEKWTSWIKFSIDLSTSDNPYLKFWYQMDGYLNKNYNNFWVQVSTDDNTWITVFGAQTPGDWDDILYNKKLIDLSSYSGTSQLYIRFLHNGKYRYNYLYLDNIGVINVTCPFPSDLAVNNITSSGAELSWTENGSATNWEIEWDTSGFKRGTGNVVNVNTNSNYSLTGLSASTSYDWFVRSICGMGDSSEWIGPFSFTTRFENAYIPWNEGFEYMQNYGSGVYPNGMSGYGDWVTSDGSASNNRQPHTGSGFVYTKYSANDYLYSPPFYLTEGTSYDFSFWYITDGYSGWQVQAKYGTEKSSSGMTNTIGSAFNPVNTTYQQFKGTFVPDSSGVYYLCIHVSANYNPWYITFDDLKLEESNPSCAYPSDLNTGNVTSSSAVLSWTENGNAAEWNIQYGPKGFKIGDGTIISGINNNPYTITGLDCTTAYDWYVRSVCGSGDTSSWIGPGRFMTFGDTVKTFPYIEEFSYWPPPNWIVDKYFTGSTYEWVQYIDHGKGCAEADFTHQDSEKTDVMYSPPIDLSGLSNPYLKFKWSHKYNQDHEFDSLAVDVSIDGGVSWSRIWIKGGADLNSNDGADSYEPGTFVESDSVDLSSLGENILLRFNAISGHGSNLFIDDVYIDNLPSCSSPGNQTELQLTSYSAVLSWTCNCPDATWDVQWGTSGFEIGSGSIATGITNGNYKVENLNPNTVYDWYVRSDCNGKGYSTWVGPKTFKTPCDPASIPYFETFDNTNVPGLPECMRTENNNGDDINWHTEIWESDNKASAVMDYSLDNNKDDWLFTGGLTLTGGKTYQINFLYNLSSWNKSEHLIIDWGASPVSSAMSGNPVFDHWLYRDYSWQIGSATITPDTTGVYYIGFHDVTPAESYYFYIDDIQVVEMHDAVSWQGNVDNDWKNSSNWSTGMPPGTLTNVTIPPGKSNYPTLTSNVYTNNLTIESTSEGDGSLIGANHIYSSGTETVQRYITGGRWHDISAMVRYATVEDVYFNHSPDVWMNEYNEADDSRTPVVDLDTPMPLGKGFEIWVKTGYNATAEFTGEINRDDVTPDIYYSDASHGYNLIGNPFSSAIQWGKGSWNLYNIDDQIWIWDGTGWKDYVSGSGIGSITDGIIPLGQGFFVHANGASPSLTIPLDAQVHSNNMYYKDKSKIPYIVLTAKKGNKTDKLFVAFHEGSTEAWENGYDGRKMLNVLDGAAPQIYSKEGDEFLSIDCLPPLDENGRVIQVYYKATANGEQSITLEDFDQSENIGVWLEDLKTGNVQYLNENPVYKFTAQTEDNPARFLLHLNREITNVDNTSGSSGIKIYSYGNNIYVASNNEISKENKEIIIYDVSGHVILRKMLPAGSLNRIPVNTSDSYLIVKVISRSAVSINKVFVE